MSKRHQASRRRSYGRRQHEVHEREVRRPDEMVDATADAWARRSQSFERSRTPIEVTVRVARSQVRYLRAARIVEPGERPTVVAQFEGLDHAVHVLLAYGAQAEVLAPPALRDRIAAAAAETAALYADSRA